MTKGQLTVQNPLVVDVRQLIDTARQRVAMAVIAELTQLYWQIGHRIGTEILQGQRADYGKQVVAELARQLTADLPVKTGELGINGQGHTLTRSVDQLTYISNQRVLNG